MRRLLKALAVFAIALFSIGANAQTLSASPSTVYTGQAVSAAWSGIGSPSTQDWIALYPAGAADTAYVAYVYTGGGASGSVNLTVPANTAAGPYELRFFSNNSFTKLATSNAFALVAPTGSLSASPATVYKGQAVTAAWSSLSAPTSTDWIALYPAGAADTAYVAFVYTNGNASGSAPLTVPPNIASGTYELRIFTNNSFQRVATSNSFAVQTPTGNLSASPSTVYTGLAVTAAWSSLSAPTATDWIALYPAGAADTAFVTLVYTGGGASGSIGLTVPPNTAAGTYELRMFTNDSYQRVGTSSSFVIQAPPAATLSVSPATTPPGTSVTVTWGSVAAPTVQDWIGLYPANAADTAFVAWRYITGTAAGSVPFSVPANLANGAYQVRLFSNNGYQRLGTANLAIGTATLSFIHTDHLNTPRQVYDDQQQLRWRWDQAEPFGVSAPDENPINLGAFELPLRFPGQYADKETNNHYNFFRDYDPNIGRYVESDLIGLRGGLNTYIYVASTPLKYTDFSGLGALDSLRDFFIKKGLERWVGKSVGAVAGGKCADKVDCNGYHGQYRDVLIHDQCTEMIVIGGMGRQYFDCKNTCADLLKVKCPGPTACPLNNLGNIVAFSVDYSMANQ